MIALGVETAETIRAEIDHLRERRARERAKLATAERDAADLRAQRRGLLLAEDKKAIDANGKSLDAAMRTVEDGAAVLVAIQEALTKAGNALYSRERATFAAELAEVEAELPPAKADLQAKHEITLVAAAKVNSLTARQVQLSQDAGNDERRRRALIAEATDG